MIYENTELYSLNNNDFKLEILRVLYNFLIFKILEIDLYI